MSAVALDSLEEMAEAIMLRAHRDLTASTTVLFDDEDTGRLLVEARQDAIDFLTAATPEWAESLEVWCALSRTDPNKVIARTKEYIAKGAFI